MVARKFVVDYDHSNFDVDYDTADGLEVLTLSLLFFSLPFSYLTSNFHFQVFKFQLFSLTSVPPDEQKICGVDDDRIVSEDSDLVSISDKLRLVSITEQTELDAEIVKSDEELARMLQAEEEALMFQQFTAIEDNGVMEQRLRPYVDQVLKYEDPHRQEAARKTVPLEKLEEKALVSLAKEGIFKPSKNEHDHALLLQLLYWFKQSFRWVNSPPCDGCGSATINQGMGTVNPLEIAHGASRVELYRCNVCSRITRFPRYNDPLKLLETRKGRCGEWANCFTLYCRAFGYESRLIMDFTDHVWTECYSVLLGRWMHLDPCEGIYDNPLLYEKGWKKNLNYVIALAKDGVHDVTKRYTRKWHEVLSRRNITSEPALNNVLFNLTRECRKNLPSQVVSTLEERDHKEAEELEKYLHSKGDASISLPGRLSGDKEWRISRSETDSDKDNSSLSSSTCPIRKCIDEHVTRIYNAFGPVISRLADLSSSQSKHVEVLHFFRRILVDLKNAPFRQRRTSIDSNIKDAKFFIEEILPSFNQMFDALSLKNELEANGKVVICLSGDPVKTSLAMPVVFHALDDVIHNINQCDNFNNSSLTWPLLKLNRICSGLVLASGEELPFGIASSAFDGTRLSKWEEPNGARGCWIMYKIVDEQVHELSSYELMSANDAPERDPTDWVLEGSDDGGSSWHVLDRQTSQIFESRFQRRTYKITSEPFPSNAFRLRILAVRDVQANSRFQIGSIDLYARKNVLLD